MLNAAIRARVDALWDKFWWVLGQVLYFNIFETFCQRLRQELSSKW